MKKSKLLITTATVLVLLTACACTGSETNSPPETPPETPVQQATQEPPVTDVPRAPT